MSEKLQELRKQNTLQQCLRVYSGSQWTQSEGESWPDGGASGRQWLRKKYNGGAAAAIL